MTNLKFLSFIAVFLFLFSCNPPPRGEWIKQETMRPIPAPAPKLPQPPPKAALEEKPTASVSQITPAPKPSSPVPKKTAAKVKCDPIPEELEVVTKQPGALKCVPSATKENPLIVIDPGHGGKDLGTHSKKAPKYQEKVLNLATAKMVRQYLQKWGYQTVMTRKDDVFITLENRSTMANNLRSKLFVSIHYNSAPSKEAEGVEVFFFRNDQDAERTKKSKKLAQSILSRVITQTEAKSRGVKHGNLAVIRETKMPAILIEGGFLTNPQERDKLRDKEYLKKIALGIAKGIDDYIKKDRILAK